MARNGKKNNGRRRTRAFNILSALEAYTYADLITRTAFNESPIGFLTGKGNVANIGFVPQQPENYAQYGVYAISLADIIKNPTVAIGVASMNLQKDFLPMALKAFGVGVAFRFGRKLLSRQISSINRNLVTPALGKTVRV